MNFWHSVFVRAVKKDGATARVFWRTYVHIGAESRSRRSPCRLGLIAGALQRSRQNRIMTVLRALRTQPQRAAIDDQCQEPVWSQSQGCPTCALSLMEIGLCTLGKTMHIACKPVWDEKRWSNYLKNKCVRMIDRNLNITGHSPAENINARFFLFSKETRMCQVHCCTHQKPTSGRITEKTAAACCSCHGASSCGSFSENVQCQMK